MLTLEIVAEIKRLLDNGSHSQRKIAAMLRVSRGTVQAIASGKRGLHGREPTAELQALDAQPTRCPGCGARVYLPCVLCRAREYRLYRGHMSKRVA